MAFIMDKYACAEWTNDSARRKLFWAKLTALLRGDDVGDDVTCCCSGRVRYKQLRSVIARLTSSINNSSDIQSQTATQTVYGTVTSVQSQPAGGSAMMEAGELQPLIQTV